jgi:hypothetical protein
VTVSNGQKSDARISHSLPLILSTYTGFFALRRLFFSTELPAGATRVEWTCRCGHISYDDFPSSPETTKALEDGLHRCRILRRVVITSQRPSLLYEWLLSIRNIILGPFRQHVSTNSSNPGSSSSEPLEVSSANSQGIASGSNLQPLGDSGDVGTTRPSLRKQRKVIESKPAEVGRKRILHVCVDIGRGTCLEVIEVVGQGPNITCDQELARQLKIIHVGKWPIKYGLFLKLRAIRFVEVSP